MLLGNKTEDIKVGNFDTKMLAGNRSLDIKIGNYLIKVGVGNIEIKTTLGSIDVKTSTGNVTISGTLGVKVKSAVKVEIDAPQVKVGGLPIHGGIVNDGPAGHKCYITGGPHLGSKTVTCNNV